MILKISQGIKVDRIDTYLNWLLKREKFQKVGREVFNFVEHFKPEVDINDIASFALGDDLHINKNDIFKQTLTATKEVLNKILCACNMDVDLNNVFDAFITFKIKKVAREDSNKKKKVIQTLLKELKDANLTVFNKNGQPMNLDKIKSTKEVSITHTESGFPDEAELEKEMLVYLQEILNEKNNDAN